MRESPTPLRLFIDKQNIWVKDDNGLIVEPSRSGYYRSNTSANLYFEVCPGVEYTIGMLTSSGQVVYDKTNKVKMNVLRHGNYYTEYYGGFLRGIYALVIKPAYEYAEYNVYNRTTGELEYPWRPENREIRFQMSMRENHVFLPRPYEEGSNRPDDDVDLRLGTEWSFSDAGLSDIGKATPGDADRATPSDADREKRSLWSKLWYNMVKCMAMRKIMTGGNW